MNASLANRRGILLMIAGSSIFASNDAFSKLALAHIPPSEILAVRGAMAALMLVAYLAWKGQFSALRYCADKRVMLRASAEACIAMLFITAIASMSLADATAILQVVPLVTMAAAVMFFGARIGRGMWIAVAAGFLGVTLIVKPGSSAFDVTALLPLGCAFLCSFRDFVTGRIGAHVPTLVVTIATAGIGMLLGFAGSTVEQWAALDLVTFFYLVGGSVTLIAGHTLTIAAFRGTDPSTISPFRYAGVVCSVALSATLFHQMPDLVSIGGIAVILAAALYTMHQHMSAPKVVVTPAKPAVAVVAAEEPRKAA